LGDESGRILEGGKENKGAQGRMVIHLKSKCGSDDW
jgi:hypothetical protein